MPLSNSKPRLSIGQGFDLRDLFLDSHPGGVRFKLRKVIFPRLSDASRLKERFDEKKQSSGG